MSLTIEPTEAGIDSFT